MSEKSIIKKDLAFRNPADYSKFSVEYMRFAYDEADKSLSESLVSYREVTNKSYIAVAFYLSALVFFFDHRNESIIYTILSIVASICIALIFFNLLSSKMHSPGIEPRHSGDSFYTDIDDPYRELLISKMINIDIAINANYKVVRCRNKRFKISASFFILACIIAFLYILSGI